MIGKLISKIRLAAAKLRLRFGIARPCHYISGSDSLPPPLTAAEEAELMLSFDTDKNRVKHELITHNLRLVVYIAKKFEATGAGTDDLVSIGTIGLIKAVNTFCPERNIKLATYASRCIENEILMYLRKSASLKSEVSIDEPLNVDWDGNELLLSDILGSDENEVGSDIEREDEKRTLNNLVSSLNDRERRIMNLRFGMAGCREHTQKEVADMLGISQSYISRLEKRIITRLRKELEKQAQPQTQTM